MKAMVNVKIHTGTGKTLEKGTVLFSDKILKVGENISLPEGVEVIDGEGLVLTPGLIDPHTHICNFQGRSTLPGVKDGNEYSSPVTPYVRALDAVNPEDVAIARTRRAGFTTVFTTPGSANVIGGVGCAIKLRGMTAEDMYIPGTEMMKMALGENPKRFFGLQKKLPVTRMGVAGLLRQTLYDAKVYSDALLAYEKGEGEKPTADFEKDALVSVVRGEQVCRIHAHRADDIVTANRIAKEFGLDFVVEHATEGYKIKEYLAKEKVRCVVGPVALSPAKLELWDISLNNAKELSQAGVTIALTEDTDYNTWQLLMHIGILIREGLSWEVALGGITLEAAKILKLDHRVGSVEEGKDADFAIFDGDLFSNYTNCLMTIIDGVIYTD
ncbi:MAG TPA: amidohydrolase family protein [Clostridia bacterium]|nr:amidohydrolase family protein [Clostridia bacterium]